MPKATLLLILALGMSGVEIDLGQKPRDKSKRPPKEKLKLLEKEKGAPPKKREKGTSKKRKPNAAALNQSSYQEGT